MMVKRGDYDVIISVIRHSKMATIERVYNNKTKELFKGRHVCSSRIQYDKFFDDLDKDIIPEGLPKWIKPKDEMSEAEVKRVMEVRKN